MRERSVTYKDLARALNASESSVKRWMSTGGFSFSAVCMALEYLEMPMGTIERLIESYEEDANIYSVTLAEDAYFFKNREIYAYLVLLYHYESLPQLRRNVKISSSKEVRFLAALEKLGFIRRLTSNKVLLLRARTLRFPRQGRMVKEQSRRTRSEFMDNPFEGPKDFLEMALCEYDAQHVNLVLKHLKKAQQEILALHQQDPPSEAQTFAVLFAMRPWKWNFLEDLKKLLQEKESGT